MRTDQILFEGEEAARIATLESAAVVEEDGQNQHANQCTDVDELINPSPQSRLSRLGQQQHILRTQYLARPASSDYVILRLLRFIAL